MTDIEKMLAKANAVENDLYPPAVNKKLIENHPCGDEVAILRKTLYALIHGLPIPQEFEAYYNEAEGIKASVKEELGID